jgi:serine/threonine protein kinase
VIVSAWREAQDHLDPSTPALSEATEEDYTALLEGTAYRAIAPLGGGAMGEVFEAEHIALGKRVVVKLMRERHLGRPDLVDRMRIEAQALAKISHPNLVQVTDFGQTAVGRTFLVMERLLGRTLRAELEERRELPVLEAIDVVRQALSGLFAAHAAGVVHRDVKLDNLFLCDAVEGRRALKVLDFGLAKVIGAAGDVTPAPLAFPTAEGVAMGTPKYFSPEQARGLPVDPRTDVYAAGAVLYTLLAGRGPFDQHTTLLELARAHAFEAPEPPSRWASQVVPHEVDAAVMKALAKAPEDRFTSASAFAAELERIARDLTRAGAKESWDPADVMLGVPSIRLAAAVHKGSTPPPGRVATVPPGRITTPPPGRVATVPPGRISTLPEHRPSAPPGEVLPYRRTLNTPLPPPIVEPTAPAQRSVPPELTPTPAAFVTPVMPVMGKLRHAPVPWRVRTAAMPSRGRASTPPPPQVVVASEPPPPPEEAPIEPAPLTIRKAPNRVVVVMVGIVMVMVAIVMALVMMLVLGRGGR